MGTGAVVEVGVDMSAIASSSPTKAAVVQTAEVKVPGGGADDGARDRGLLRD